MTSIGSYETADAVRAAAQRASLAPSVHNTQPWMFRTGSDTLEIHADWRRKLAYVDPKGRQLLLSCGCALLNARAHLEGTGHRVRVERFAPQAPQTLVARLHIEGPLPAPSALGALDGVIELRQTNRRRFNVDLDGGTVGDDVADVLSAAARAEDCTLAHLIREEQRLTVARLTQQADGQQNSDPIYRAEIRAWTTSDPGRRDGVPALAAPHVTGAAQDDVPIRDFDIRGDGMLPSHTGSSVRQSLFVLTTAQDDPMSWVRAGEALERVWLEAFRHGFTASLFTQPIEQPATRQQLRQELQTRGYPHIVLRIGRAPRTPPTRRRDLADMIDAAPADSADSVGIGR